MTFVSLTNLPCNFDGTAIESPQQLWGLYFDTRVKLDNITVKKKQLEPLVVGCAIDYFRSNKRSVRDTFFVKDGYKLRIQKMAGAPRKDHPEIKALQKRIDAEKKKALARNKEKAEYHRIELEYLSQTEEGRQLEFEMVKLVSDLTNPYYQVAYGINK